MQYNNTHRCTHNNTHHHTKPRTPIAHDTLRQLIKAAERKWPRHGLLIALRAQLKNDVASITDAQLALVKRLAE